MSLAGFEPTISVGKQPRYIIFTFHYLWTIAVGFVRDLLTIFLQSFEIGHYTLTHHGMNIWKYFLQNCKRKGSAEWGSQVANLSCILEIPGLIVDLDWVSCRLFPVVLLSPQGNIRENALQHATTIAFTRFSVQRSSSREILE